MALGHKNGVVGLIGFSDRRMCGLLFRPKKVCNKGVVVLQGSTVFNFRAKHLLSTVNVKVANASTTNENVRSFFNHN